jgi:hypothetical protein
LKSVLFDPLQSTVFTPILRLAVVAALLTCATAAHADCPTAPLASPDDMVVSFLASTRTQAAPASLYASTVKEGMLLYDDTANALKLCDGSVWHALEMSPSQWNNGTSGTIYYSSGNVGIGTASPQATLDVNGTMRLTKNAAAPTACSNGNDASFALTSNYTWCVCNGSSSTWVRTTDGTTACSW